MDAQQILDIAFREAKKMSNKTTIRKKGEAKYIEMDLIKLNVANSIAIGYLNAYIKQASYELTEFEKELMGTLINVHEKNKQVEKIKSVIKILKKLKSEYEMKIKYSEHKKQSNKERTAFYGRMSSLIKKLKFDAIESFTAELGTIPKIKKMDTIIIAGYPNVGKSQILKTMSGHKIKTAAYPFTTKELLIGFAKNRYSEFQLIDTPGILDRPIEKRNEIEQKALFAMKYISKNILFVVDPSETCGYSLEDQMNLKREIEKKFNPKMFTVATKKDIKNVDINADFMINAKNKEDVNQLRLLITKYFF